MKDKVIMKPTYPVGFEGVSPTGEKYTVIEYSGRKNILVRFECGFEKNTTSTYIKNGDVKYTKRNSKTFLGDKLIHKSGMLCEVVEYTRDSQIVVLFENGARKSCRYSDILNGRVSTNIPLKDIEVGQVFTTNTYGDVDVVKYISPHNVQVVFKDGTNTTVAASSLRRGNVGHPKSGVPEGYTFTNGDGVVGVVHKYVNHDNIHIRWEDGVITKKHYAVGIKRRQVYYPNFKSVVGVGYFGIGKYKSDRCGTTGNYSKVVYKKWMDMIIRCYSEEEQKKSSCRAYIGCKVCPEWHNFQNFALWSEQHIVKFEGGYELDKDILGTGKLYCPKYCVPLPRTINIFLSDSYGNKASGLPEGVNVIKPKTKGSKVGYCARCHIRGKRQYLGYYSTPEEAGFVYRGAKEGEARRLAVEYKDQITEEEFDRLINFTLESIHRK